MFCRPLQVLVTLLISQYVLVQKTANVPTKLLMPMVSTIPVLHYMQRMRFEMTSQIFLHMNRSWCIAIATIVQLSSCVT